MAFVQIVAMTQEHAADIVTWRYAEPYERYDLIAADPGFLTDPANGYVALVDGGVLIGYRSFGVEGRVPGGSYDDSALDTGGGLRPVLTGLGHGLGRQAIAAGLAYGYERFQPAAFRVTVASFNTRARKVVESLGFVHVATFNATTDGSSFDILTCQQSLDRR
ncbi:GNAT family N-acetyltransferase [Streptacidiphilus albus]|uniref:GNAT family N-acetyltransferase n=1 Tax=Streptacidiphilus albus TaxID=105425 RepID=UPI00054C5F46|nr:GNAT family N-acetyltransferase [Streptacidiphilus albus]